MKKAIFHGLMCFAMMAGFATNAAEKGKTDADTDESSGSETVIVPFDGTKPLKGQNPTQVYVPYERFIELWEAAKATKHGIPPDKLDEHFVLGSSRYDATLEKNVLRVQGVIDLQTFGDGWVSVPMVFDKVKIGSLTLDGQPALLSSGKVAIEKAGPHRIGVEFQIPVKTSNTRLSWGVPQTAGTLVSLTLPDKQMKASVTPGNGAVERINGNQKIVTAAVGSTNRIEVALDSSVGLATMTQAALTKITATLNVTPAVESLRADYEFSFPESRQDHFTVVLDKSLALVKLDVPNLKSWKLSVQDDRQMLEIVVAEPVRESFKFSIDAESPAAEAQRRFPFLSAAANRIEQTQAIFSTLDLSVTPQPSTAFRQVSFDGDAQPGSRLVAAYAVDGDKEVLKYDAQPARPVSKAEISYVYQVNHTKIELVAALKLRQERPALFDITIGLPADFVVQAVESERLKDWWRDGDALHVRFHDAPLDSTPLVLHLVKQYKTTPDQLDIKPLVLPASWEVEGTGIIAANKSMSAGLTLVNAKELNPQNAATDFRILPPMERKRGFSFKGRDFSATVKLETLPARIAAEWVMSARAYESRVSLSIHTKLTARQGSTGGISFKLPAAAPEARVSGDNVRETASGIDGDWRVYRVAFQHDLTDDMEFTADLDLPGDGKTLLPAFEISGIDRADGFIVVDNASEYEIQVEPSGLDAALGKDIPFLPEISRNARLFRTLPGWSLKIGLTRLEKEAGRSAFVAWAEMTTALRADGSEWHKASYHLQNRSLQFLPVKLPNGAELASVSVAGENVRPDRGEVAGKKVLLIPLIKTKPGDMAYDVDLVYRKRAGHGLRMVNHDTLGDPEVVGITVERTLWNIYVPEELSAGGFGGNMEEVIEEVNRTEKLEGMLDELKSLNGLVSLGRKSSVSKKAGDNFRLLAKKLEESNSNMDDSDQWREKPAPKKGAFQQQGVYVAQKKREIQEELVRQRQQYESNVTKNAVVTRSQRGGVPQGNEIVDGDQLQDLQKAVEPAAVTQKWASNSGFISGDKGEVEKAKDVDRRDADGKKLYVNDYVMNVQGVDARKSKQSPDRLIMVNGGGNLGVSGGTVTITAGQTQVLGDVAAKQAEPQMKLAQQQQQDLAQQLQPLQTELESSPAHNAPLLMQQAAKADAQSDKPQALAEARKEIAGINENVIVLNSARANAKLQVAQEAPQEMQSLAAAVSAAPAAPVAPGLPATGNEPTDATGFGVQERGGPIDGSGLRSGEGGGGKHKTAPAPPAPQLQHEGAISLPVDFPTEGHVYHFKKLKANAKLTLWITRPASTERWTWFLVFVIAAAALKGIFLLVDRGGWRFAKARSNR